MTPRNLVFWFIVVFFGLWTVGLTGCEATRTRNPTTMQSRLRQPTETHDSGNLGFNAFGPGIHRNAYGQPVILRPDWGGVPGEYLEIQQNAYGLGVHMDQYGRPVRAYPWP